MDRVQFESVLQGAIAGRHDDLEDILHLYEPMIRKYSFINDNYDEDLHQYLLIHIALNISKFTL